MNTRLTIFAIVALLGATSCSSSKKAQEKSRKRCSWLVGGDGQNLQLWEGRGARQGTLDVYKPPLHGKRRKGSP